MRRPERCQTNTSGREAGSRKSDRVDEQIICDRIFSLSAANEVNEEEATNRKDKEKKRV